MVSVAYSVLFEKSVKKIHDNAIKERVKAQNIKIISNPETGKPMRYCRKNTREVNIPPFHLSCFYEKHKEILVFLALYHKDSQ
jgi:mRNA-degrading endonuclease RelE of RelBE toxin-antitoxin system